MKINSFYFKNNDTGESTVDFTGGNAKDVSQDTLISYLQDQVNSLNSYLNTEYQRVPTSKVQRCIGEFVFSPIPLRDAGLHLLDGSIISGYGEYLDFVNTIKSYVDDFETEIVQEVEKNYSIHGTLSYNQETGEVSQFSSDSYIEGSSFFKPDRYTWEKYLTFTTGTLSSVEIIYGQNPEYTIKFGTYNKTFRIWLSSNGSDFNIADTRDTGVQVEPNTKYFVKIEYTGNDYRIYINKENNFDTPVLIINDNTPFISGYKEVFGTQLGDSCFNGSIDLRNTYSIIHKDQDQYIYIERVVDKEKYIPKYSFICTEEEYNERLEKYGVVGEFCYNKQLNYVRLPKISPEFKLVQTEESEEIDNKQYIYVCIANGEVLQNDIKNTVELVNPYNLFDLSNNSKNQENLAWLKADGLWRDGEVYPSAYEKILEIGRDVTDEIDNNQLNILSKYQFDYIYNTNKKQFRLPLKNNSQRFLVEEKLPSEEDKTWYRVYSDGYCEQGSEYIANNLSTFSIEFSKRFINKFYSISVQSKGSNYTSSIVIDNNGKEPGFCTCYRDGTDTEYEYRAEGFTECPIAPLYYYVGSVARKSDVLDINNLNISIDKLSAEIREFPHVIKTYNSNSIGYVIYSNGLCLQYGKIPGGTRHVNLPVEMANGNYSIQISLFSSDPNTTVRACYYYNTTTTGFDTWNHWQGGSNNNYSTYESRFLIIGYCNLESALFTEAMSTPEIEETRQNSQSITDIRSELEALTARVKLLEDTGTKVVDSIPTEVTNNTMYIVKDE